MSALTGGSGGDTFMPSFGMPNFDFNNPSSFISNSTMMLMTQISSMMTMVMGMLMATLQDIMQARQNGGSGGLTSTLTSAASNGGGPASAGGSGEVPPGAGGPGIEGAIREAQSLEGLTEGGDTAKLQGILNGVNPAETPWCAYFVSAMFERHGGSPWGHEGAVSGIQQWGQENGHYFDRHAGVPRRGDVMIEKRGGKSHTGIVTSVTDNGDGTYSFTTIEGNTSDSVHTRHYTSDSSTLSGFVRPFEKV